jgi:hypothetical protein
MTYQSSPLITDDHSKLCAHVLRRRHSVSDSEKLAGVLLQIDLNSHQVEATPFAFELPLGTCRSRSSRRHPDPNIDTRDNGV